MSSTNQNEFVTSSGVMWDDPEEGKTWLVSLVSIVTLCGLVIFLSVVYFRTEQNFVQERVVDDSYTALQSRKAAQFEILTRSGPYTTEVGGKQVTRQRMPIGKAMEAMVANPKLGQVKSAAVEGALAGK